MTPDPPLHRCEVTGRVRARDRCWRAECEPCSSYNRMAVLDYLRLCFGPRLSTDRGQAPAKRRCLFVTLRASDAWEWESFRQGVSRSFLPWVGRRLRVSKYFGVILPPEGRQPGHVHLLVIGSGRIPKPGLTWTTGHPSGAETWAATSAGALDVRLARGDDEVQLRPGGPLVPTDRLAADVAKRVSDSTCGSFFYLAAQSSVVGVPVNCKFWIESSNCSAPDFRGFADFRDYTFERGRLHPLMPRLDPSIGGNRLPITKRRIPSYTNRDRAATRRALASARSAPRARILPP